MISTSLRDVVVPYGEMGLVLIADTVNDFAQAIEKARLLINDKNWKKKVRQVLKSNSWDLTWQGMKRIIMATLDAKVAVSTKELTPASKVLSVASSSVVVP